MTDRSDRTWSVSRNLRAGCFDCNGTEPMWEGPNAQGVSVRHHDATGHQTWCHIDMLISYGVGAVSREAWL